MEGFFMKILNLLVVLLGLVSGFVHAGTFLSPDLTCEGFKKIVTEGQLTTIDQVIPLLPAEYRKNSVLVYDSHGMHQDLVSFETPRAILFNENASMMISFHQHPGAEEIKKGHDRFELICFNQKTWLFEFYDVVMDGKRTPFKDYEPELNPKSCLKCHGSNPRPILQDYNAWPGFYGSFSQAGSSAAGSIEKEKFLSFIAKAPAMDRYKHLDFSMVKPNPEDKTETDPSQKDLVYYDADDYKFSPVVNLGIQIQRNMEYRVAKKIIDKLKSGQYKSIRSLLAYVGSDLNTCGNIRQRIGEVYEAMVAANNLAENAKIYKENLLQTVENDFQEFKVVEFLKFNSASLKLDPRGILSLPRNNLTGVVDQFYPDQDRESLAKQFILLQAVSDYLGLTSEDLSTFPNAPSLGLGHVARGGLYKDEQYFLGITEAMLAIDQFVIRRIESNCAEVKSFALQQAALLKIGTEPTLFKKKTKE